MATISALHLLIGFATGVVFTTLLNTGEFVKIKKVLEDAIDAKFKQDERMDELLQEIDELKEKNQKLERSVDQAVKALTSTYTMLPPPSPTLERQGGPYYPSPDSPLSFTLDEDSKE